MTKDKKIKELELEVARLKGVVEGMRTANPYYLYPPAPLQPVIRPYPYWYQTYCGAPMSGGSTAQFTATPNSATTVGYANATGISHVN